ncbi:MAG: hypothetical protein WCA21_01825 [Terracidiphilus sp.]
MPSSSEELELKDRLRLIESMIAEGRRTTSSYGWTFVLWGVAYYVAILWGAIFHNPYAWPVTMMSTAILMAVILWRKSIDKPKTTRSRAIGAIWYSMGISLFVLLFSLGYSGRADQHTLIAAMAAMLGATNAASSIILRWKLQFACAVVWWALTILACFGHGQLLTIAFLAALFLCQIVFGVYLMIHEARVRKLEASHA